MDPYRTSSSPSSAAAPAADVSWRVDAGEKLEQAGYKNPATICNILALMVRMTDDERMAYLEKQKPSRS